MTARQLSYVMCDCDDQFHHNHIGKENCGRLSEMADSAAEARKENGFKRIGQYDICRPCLQEDGQ